MLKKPISIKDLYITAGLLSFLLVCTTAIVFPNIFTILSAFSFPLLFITVQLVLLSETYTEENLVQISPLVFKIYSIVIGGIVIGLLLFTTDIYLILWLCILYIITIVPFYAVKTRIGGSYNEIQFGFRNILPQNKLWKSATVFLYNGEISKWKISKLFWYTIAHYRFVTLTHKLDSTHPYANHTIANKYKKATDISITDDLTVNEQTFGEIFDEFTKQSCIHCSKTSQINQMYLLTDENILSEAFCSECIKASKNRDENQAKINQQEPNQQTNSNQQTEDENTDSERIQNNSIKQACEIFGYSEEEFTNVSESDIKTKYRELVQKHHPDVGGNEEQFKLILDAYEKLKNEIDD